MLQNVCVVQSASAFLKFWNDFRRIQARVIHLQFSDMQEDIFQQNPLTNDMRTHQETSSKTIIKI